MATAGRGVKDRCPAWRGSSHPRDEEGPAGRAAGVLQEGGTRKQKGLDKKGQNFPPAREAHPLVIFPKTPTRKESLVGPRPQVFV